MFQKVTFRNGTTDSESITQASLRVCQFLFGRVVSHARNESM